MSGLEEVRSRPAGELERYGTNGTSERTTRTFSDWASKAAKLLRGQKEKSYDDTAFRRGRAMRFPSVPGEEKRFQDVNLGDWIGRDLEGATTGHPKRYQTKDTGERARRTLLGRAMTAAKVLGRQKDKSDDDFSYRRGHAMAYPTVPGEEARNQLGVVPLWPSGDLEVAKRIHSATDKENADREMSNVLESQTPIPSRVLPRFTIPHLSDDPRRGSEEPSSESCLCDSELDPAGISDGTSKSIAVDDLLTEAMQ